ncbi:MAG: beta-propeller fold lactonase family protein [Acidobacteriia bacterium]|nr:beta-propeller fold lactonase family protein [Terriglobia bacterium]
MKRRTFLGTVAAAGLTAELTAKRAAATPAMAVVEKKAGKVAFYTTSGIRLSEVKVGIFPHEMAWSPDRRLLFVTDNGLLWMTDTGEGSNTISVIDAAARRKVGIIDLGIYHRPHGIAVLPKGQLIVTIENPNGLLLIDPVARKVLRKYEVGGEHPHMVLLGPKAETAWASNTNSAEVAVINLASGEVEKRIPTGRNPQGGVITKDGNWIYLTNNASNTISVIDTNERAVTGDIKTGNGPARIALTPDEQTLAYNLQAGEAVGFADVRTRTETSRIKLPGRPLSLALSTDGRIAYLGLQDSDKIAIVSVPDRKIIGVIDTPAGAGPDTVLPLELAEVHD